ncbi:hypothetical protein [Pantoea ananatis]|uniref:capsular polysaccharide export protein, LipB/KpsS family n=1 Tax=Pantoea ananas TaxID=553 RepID=UPI001F4E0D4B|nr:hypothetical protein [Pantoea ananatis]MCH9267728.1 hypothetical protein [Pantoea ananatis]
MKFNNVLVYIEPWIENSKPAWKKDYIWWFGELINQLNLHSLEEIDTKFLVGDDVAHYWEENINCNADIIVISQCELKSIFPDYTNALKSWLSKKHTDEKLSSMSNVIKSKLGEFTPDVIFTITPVPFLASLYQKSLILHRDALYCREPWPDELTCFDPCGINIHSIINTLASELNCLKNDYVSDEFVNEIRNGLLHDVKENNLYIEKIALFRDKFKKLILLPLQSNGHYNFYCATEFNNQFDYLYYVLMSVPRNFGVIVTNHPDDKTLNEITITYLEKTFANFIYIKDFESHHSPSQFILPHVDSLVCVSSGLCYQAMIWEKPVYLVGESPFSKLFRNLKELSVDSCFENVNYSAILMWLLTHYFASYTYIKNGKWLTNYIKNFLLEKETKNIKLSSFTMIDSNENILKDLILRKRKIRTFKPELEKETSTTELNAVTLNNLKNDYTSAINELQHYKKAYKEAILVQDSLKSDIENLKCRGLFSRIFNW